ncbi:alpha/beta hydrolase family protein [Rubritalea spongiae]|uniref:Alpha/beta hydrolase family protein n=1 Tax=Rubritalea spongiae TaxID=430797 RepID=A0ABW5E9W9_9BACT
MKYLLTLFILVHSLSAKDTFVPLREGDDVPMNVVDLWSGLDLRTDPIEKEIVKTYEEDGVVCEYVMYTVATIKGKRSRIAAYYTYPKGGKDLPAFVWAHGGGQRAEKERGIYFAKQGYATLDINWNGRELDPDVKKNTDWGNVDPTQGKRFYPKALREKRHTGAEPDEYTIDAVVSPRNKYWFMLAYAGRRGITFLEQQEQVDPERIGFTGFSMGGNITSFCAIDKRLKAVAPIVGGSGFSYDRIAGYPSVRGTQKNHDLLSNTIEPQAYWPHVTAPVMFISGTNDFHGRLDFLQRCADLLPKDTVWTMSQTMHNNHSPGSKQYLALEYWFDHYLKGEVLAVPTTAQSSFSKVSDDMWRLEVTPDDIENVEAVQIYYSWDTAISNRFNKPIETKRNGHQWSAEIPTRSELPVTAFANILYKSHSGVAEETLSGKTDVFSITSRFYSEIPDQMDEEMYVGLQLDRTFEPVFAEFPKDNLIWAVRPQDQSVITYKFNDYALAFPSDKKLKFQVVPADEELNLIVSFSSHKHLIKSQNELSKDVSISKRFKEAGDLVISLDELVKESGNESERISSWHNVSTMKVSLRKSSRERINLLDPETSGKYLRSIEWVD